MLVSRHFVQLGEFEVSEEGGITVGEISRTASGSTPTTSATTPLNPTLHRAIPPLPIPSASLKRYTEPFLLYQSHLPHSSHLRHLQQHL